MSGDGTDKSECLIKWSGLGRREWLPREAYISRSNEQWYTIWAAVAWSLPGFLALIWPNLVAVFLVQTGLADFDVPGFLVEFREVDGVLYNANRARVQYVGSAILLVFALPCVLSVALRSLLDRPIRPTVDIALWDKNWRDAEHKSTAALKAIRGNLQQAENDLVQTFDGLPQFGGGKLFHPEGTPDPRKYPTDRLDIQKEEPVLLKDHLHAKEVQPEFLAKWILGRIALDIATFGQDVVAFKCDPDVWFHPFESRDSASGDNTAAQPESGDEQEERPKKAQDKDEAGVDLRVWQLVAIYQVDRDAQLWFVISVRFRGMTPSIGLGSGLMWCTSEQHLARGKYYRGDLWHIKKLLKTGCWRGTLAGAIGVPLCALFAPLGFADLAYLWRFRRKQRESALAFNQYYWPVAGRAANTYVIMQARRAGDIPYIDVHPSSVQHAVAIQQHIESAVNRAKGLSRFDPSNRGLD